MSAIVTFIKIVTFPVTHHLKGDKPKDDTRSLRIHEIEQELEKMQAQYSSKPKVCVTALF